MSNSNIPLLASGKLFQSTTIGATAVVVSAASCVLHALELDNTANVAATFVRMHNTGTVTPGTTVPDQILMVPASTKITFIMPGGVTFGTALTITAGISAALATTTAPSSSFAIKIVYV